MADEAPTTTATGPDAGEVRGWIGDRLDVLGGSSVARVDGFYADAETGRPEWLSVRLGRFGQPTLAPARDVRRCRRQGLCPLLARGSQQRPEAEGEGAIDARGGARAAQALRGRGRCRPCR